MNKRIITIGVIALVVLGALGYIGLRYFRTSGDQALVASGTVEATEAQLGFQAPGRIESIAVREGDAVKQGEALARLDTRETEARLA